MTPLPVEHDCGAVHHGTVCIKIAGHRGDHGGTGPTGAWETWA